MIITINPTGALIPSHTYPIPSKGKSCFFIRKLPVEVTKENIKDVILFGDMSTRPIEDLAILVDEIFFPILNNPKNQHGWPELIVEDVESHLQELRNTIAEVCIIYRISCHLMTLAIYIHTYEVAALS